MKCDERMKPDAFARVAEDRPQAPSSSTPPQ